VKKEDLTSRSSQSIPRWQFRQRRSKVRCHRLPSRFIARRKLLLQMWAICRIRKLRYRLKHRIGDTCISHLSPPFLSPIPHPYNANDTINPKIQPNTKQAQHDFSTQGKGITLHLIHLLPTSPGHWLTSDTGTSSRNNRLIVCSATEASGCEMFQGVSALLGKYEGIRVQHYKTIPFLSSFH
jgi:hypothetical protein